MTRRWLVLLSLAWTSALPASESLESIDIDAAPHRYRERTPTDRFTKLKADLEAGRVTLDSSGEKAFLASLLRELDIPASSQMLVFSTTSLQLSLITPSNPRAVYFSEDLYVGFIPRGKIEIVALDPELGGIFYIFEIPKSLEPPRADRSNRCMNCHAGSDTQFVPGVALASVIPGLRGGSLVAFRQEKFGHGIPLEERFGGWYVTGAGGITNHAGNFQGRLSPEGLTKLPLDPASAFDGAKYLIGTSDILPQLLMEHQAGFVNRVVEASYRARGYLHQDGDQLTEAHAKILDQRAEEITRYLLFADEAPLPAAIKGAAEFKEDFRRNRRAAADGSSLKDFDLKTRLFARRCSYMIYSAVFEGLPAAMKQRIYRRMAGALSVEKPDPQFTYLPADEKQSIRRILKETLKDLPSDW